MDITTRLLLLLAFCCILRCSIADDAKPQQRFAMVVGTVYCDTCFQQQFSKASHFISGASVSVECGDGTRESSFFRKEVKTNRHGVFRIRLPPKVSRNIDNIKTCAVNLIKSNEPFCAVASSATSTGLRLKSKRNGLHVFSAGFFTFKPLKQPDLCYQEPKPDSFAEQKPAQPAFFFFFPPPIPFLPPPSLLPPNPLLPPPSLLPPNPLLPPPSLLPPVIPSPPPSVLPPIFPSPPPSVLPPIFPSPPPSLLPPVPHLPLPLLTPPPPPPASLFPPFPFPFPFPPNPLFPGNPPAAPHSAEASP